MRSRMVGLGFAATMAACPAPSAVAEERAPTVSVVGHADSDVRPDIATLLLTITIDKPTANDAAAESTRVSTAVIDGLKGSGVDAREITTAGLSLFPLMSEGNDPKTHLPIKTVVTGFRANNELRVRVRDISRTGAFAANAVQNGALYQGVSFDLSDRDTREDALRTAAVENARHHAELYAKGAGMKLGPLRSIIASGAERAIPMSYARSMATSAAAPAPLAIEPGVISLSDSINATFELAAP